MAGFKFLYISGEGKVFKIAQPKDGVFKAVPELAGQPVLRVFLHYETKNRKPWRLTVLDFDRIQLDSKGQYHLTDDEMNARMRNFREYGYVTAEELSKKTDPWVIPNAPVVPNKVEKESLVKFIKIQYPLLWENSPETLEQTLRWKQSLHQKNLDLIKEAIKLRKSKN